MGSIPVLKPQEVVQILRTIGFEEIRQRGRRATLARIIPKPLFNYGRKVMELQRIGLE